MGKAKSASVRDTIVQVCIKEDEMAVSEELSHKMSGFGFFLRDSHCVYSCVLQY